MKAALSECGSLVPLSLSRQVAIIGRLGLPMVSWEKILVHRNPKRRRVAAVRKCR